MSDNHGILPDTVAALIEGGLTVSHDEHGHEVLSCPVCNDRIAARSGWGPHKNGHLRAAGLLPPVVGKPRKPKADKPKVTRTPKASPPPLSTADACLGLIIGLTEQTTIPVHLFAEVQAWIETTDNLIERLR
jgi:hypothetical protein